MSTSSRKELPAPPNKDELAADLVAFHARFASLFARSEPRQQALKHLRGLMGPVERRNGWQLAEVVGDAGPDAAQRLLYSADWSADDARDRLMDFSVERFGDPGAIVVVDETGFLKKGTESVGVERQYTGTAGKIENCQIGVFLGYTSPRGHVLLDRRLYLPEVWCRDAERRQRAHIPADVTFQTKPQLALEMLRHAWRRGVPMAWITGDEVYGDATALRDGIAAMGYRYVLAVASNTPVWSERPAVTQPPGPHEHQLERRSQATTVAKVVAQWSPSQWRRFAIHLGEKGPIEHDWACARVVDSRARLPKDDIWLLARRSVSNPTELAYYLSNAEETTSLEMLAHVASTRYTIEQCLEEAKDDVGMDQYEVRAWPSWHRFITLSMMALAWLASVRTKLPDEGCFPYAPVLNSALGHETVTPAPGEKSPQPTTGPHNRRRWPRGAFPKFAA